MSVYTCIYTHLSSPPIPQDRLKQLNGVEDVQSSPSRPSLQPEPEPVKQLYVRSELLLLLGHCGFMTASIPRHYMYMYLR